MRRTSQSGFSMIEVVVALGLLAGVLISISGLFIMGGQQVKSGREATEALSVAREILEEMNGWAFRQTFDLYGISSTATSATIDSRTNSQAQQWQPNIDEKLFQGYALIDIESLGSGPPTFATTRAIRVMVTVHWDEGQRHRTIQLGLVRM